MLGGVDLELFSLLEKNEQRQIKLFQLLLEEKGEISVNNVLTRLSVDRATLKEDLFYLQANLENIKQLEIVIQEGNILLIRHGNIAAVDVYYHCYLRYSTKYQILLICWKMAHLIGRNLSWNLISVRLLCLAE